MISLLKNFKYTLNNKADKKDLKRIEHQIDELRFSVGVGAVRSVKGTSFNDFEIKVFSQFGEDGLLNHIVDTLQLPESLHSFIEFGVEDYSESNTRFLMEYRNWRGLVMDGSSENIAKIDSHYKWWKYDLCSKHAFITKDNINQLIENAGLSGEIGLLSIDIDGNDYWVWQAIDIVKPAIVVVEYNSHFGKEIAVTIPYSKDFVRKNSNKPVSYFGASLCALEKLGKSKGLVLIGSNLAGNNAFFVDSKYEDMFQSVSATDCWVQSRYREVKNKDGKLEVLSSDRFWEQLHGFELVDVTTEKNFLV